MYSHNLGDCPKKWRPWPAELNAPGVVADKTCKEQRRLCGGGPVGKLGFDRSGGGDFALRHEFASREDDVEGSALAPGQACHERSVYPTAPQG